MKLLIEGTKPT